MRLCGVPWAWMWSSLQQECLETQVLRRETLLPLIRAQDGAGTGGVLALSGHGLPSLNL